MGDRIDDVIEEITVDAYGEHEQLWSFRQVFEDEARFPFRGRVVGAEVEIASVDFDGDERRGLVAVCRRAGEVHKVSLLDVTPEGPLPLRTRQLLDAYRRWSSATPLAPIAQDQATPWVYPRFASVAIDVSPPLALEPIDTKGPGAAAKRYETGVAVAERSLPEGFAGVLPWGMVDNRPFLRCLYGLALCAWRQRRWDDAEAMLTARVWLDPTGPWDALACLGPIRARTRWTRS